jgi:hypothetical protein
VGTGVGEGVGVVSINAVGDGLAVGEMACWASGFPPVSNTMSTMMKITTAAAMMAIIRRCCLRLRR